MRSTPSRGKRCVAKDTTRRTVPGLVACHPSIVVQAAVVAVPPIGAPGSESLAAEPRTSTIAVTVTIVGRPPAESDTDEAVVEVIVVMDEVVVIVAMPITVPVVAVPYGPTVPATTTHSTNIGKMGTTHSANVTSIKMTDIASADVANSTDVADTTSTNVEAAHAASEASTASSVGTIESDWDKKQAARKGSCCSDTGFHD